MSSATEKTYSGYLIANWRDDDLRYRKTRPDDLAPRELSIPVSISVAVPEVSA